MATRSTPRRRWRKVGLIYNPDSGRGVFPPLFQQILGIMNSGRQHLPPADVLHALEDALLRVNIHPHTRVCRNALEATHLAQDFAQHHFDLVIVAGGDGTINAAVNGLAHTATVLGIIPLGTVNLFRMHLGLPDSITAACQVLARGRVEKIDLGRLGTHYFACLAGIGFDAYVLKGTDKLLRRSLGVMVYVFSAFLGFFTYPFKTLHIKIDRHAAEHQGYFLIVGNVKYYAGRFSLLPHAKINDGLLDVCIFKHRGFFNFLGYLWGLRRGQLEQYLDVEFLQCRTLKVRRKQYIHLDGDYFGRKPIILQVAPQALRVVV